MVEVFLSNRDQPPSSPRHLRNDDDDDDNSVSSTASSVHEIIVLETDRRKERIHRIRLRRKIAQLGLHETENPDDSVRSSGSVGGIMSVRTLDESLHGTKISEMRKLRRKVTIKVKNNLDVSNGSHSMANGTGSTEETDNVSVISGLSGISLSTAGKSSLNVQLGFAHVHIREYELVPGANPSVSSGPPVELGWAHTEPTSVDLDNWEIIRDGRRRVQAQMRIPPGVRRELLLHHGNSQRDIRDATRNAATGRKQMDRRGSTLSVS
mmetsp:Transcript_7913/g.11951  ORF Transcript_7913/g.11951 Transcript_7913/m.11951 type:complete len:266 (+) Transcript_7913:60-857(+)